MYLDAFLARQEQPMLTQMLPQYRLALAIVASATGIAVSWLIETPFGLVVPIAALFLYVRGRAVALLLSILAIAVAGLVIAALIDAGSYRELVLPWAGFLIVVLCVGGIVATSASIRAEDVQAVIPGASDRAAPFYPTSGPTPDEKAAPRHSPFVSIAAKDDEATAELMLAASFWGGTPFHLRYWRSESDGNNRWTEVRTEALRERSGIRRWNSVSTRIDDIRPEPLGPSKAASCPPNNDDAVVAAKYVERLLGNAWAFDRTGRPTYLTPFAQAFVSVTLDEFQVAADEGRTFFSRTSHPDEYEHIAAAWRQSLQTGAPFYIERRIRRASGIFDWSRTAIVPTRDSTGSVTGWYGASMDLDAYRVAELALRERERELSQLVDMVPSHLWRLTPDGEPVFYSKRMVEYLGQDIPDADSRGIGRLDALVEAIHPDDVVQFRSALGDSLVAGKSFSMRYRLRRADGVYRWMSSRAEPMRGEDGRIVQWYGLCHDINDQMHAEEALRQRERALHQLVETLPALIYCATPTGEPIYRSQQLQDFLGFGLEDKDEAGMPRLAGTLDAIIHPDDLPTVKERYGHSLSTGERYALRHRLRRFDGEYRWVETRAAAMRDSDGAIVQWNGVCFDIEDQVRAQEELRLVHDRLARASQAASLAELSASIAHEVNQPLAAIVANSHACHRWLSAEPANVERAKITAERIIRDANSAADVVSRIRALFKRSSGSRSSASYSEIIAEAHQLLAEEFVRLSIRLDVEVPNDLPLVTLDRVQVQQVLINLVRNGLEAMDSDLSERILRIRVHRDEDAIRTEISDCGRGIEFPERIFEPFFTTKERGMGMGLAVCRSIVESHGGRLWAQKNEPTGAVFAFTLPVEAKADR